MCIASGKQLSKDVTDGALLMSLLIAPGSRHCPSLWAGTNGGTVYAFCLRVPPAERRMDEPVRAEQGKYALWKQGPNGSELLLI